MPQDNCDTGRTIYAQKRIAEAADPKGQADRCDRCKGWHARSNKPKSRAGRKAKQGR